MQDLRASFGIGFVGGLRTMTACAALSWSASRQRTRIDWIPAGPGARFVATTAALAEMAGDKMPFAPDRRIPPSFAVRLLIGAVGGAALAGRKDSLVSGSLAGIAGAVAGTLLGRAARGGIPNTGSGLARGLTEDAVAVGLAAAVVTQSEQARQA